MPGIGLDELPAGSDAEVLNLFGGGSVVSRLAALGFVPGMRVSMVQNRGHGPLSVSVGGILTMTKSAAFFGPHPCSRNSSAKQQIK